MRLFRVAQRFDVEIQPQMILLHKTLFNIEGLGRELYPQLDLWKTAHPVLRRWMNEQVGGRAMLDDLRENLPQLRDALRELPGVVKNISEQARAGDIRLNMDSPELEEISHQLKAQQWQRFWLTLAATGVISGTLILALDGSTVLGSALIAAGAIAAFAGRPSNGEI